MIILLLSINGAYSILARPDFSDSVHELRLSSIWCIGQPVPKFWKWVCLGSKWHTSFHRPKSFNNIVQQLLKFSLSLCTSLSLSLTAKCCRIVWHQNQVTAPCKHFLLLNTSPNILFLHLHPSKCRLQDKQFHSKQSKCNYSITE